MGCGTTDGVTSHSLAVEWGVASGLLHHWCCWLPQLLLGQQQIQGWRGSPQQGNRSTMCRQSERGTVDQESVSAGEMSLDTAKDDQQQIMGKANITEVYRSACHCVHQ